ncbi:hypothetical protein GCM10009733_055840 [Nonomuraea maheshkhaliensis]|uniref:Uncharacterized protein n=1 Tax=Nonomuraea maheshkhaliensis TaxID=419590 RepID=A0ABP4RIE1_9ACTN
MAPQTDIHVAAPKLLAGSAWLTNTSSRASTTTFVGVPENAGDVPDKAGEAVACPATAAGGGDAASRTAADNGAVAPVVPMDTTSVSSEMMPTRRGWGNIALLVGVQFEDHHKLLRRSRQNE